MENNSILLLRNIRKGDIRMKRTCIVIALLLHRFPVIAMEATVVSTPEVANRKLDEKPNFNLPDIIRQIFAKHTFGSFVEIFKVITRYRLVCKLWNTELHKPVVLSNLLIIPTEPSLQQKESEALIQYLIYRFSVSEIKEAELDMLSRVVASIYADAKQKKKPKRKKEVEKIAAVMRDLREKGIDNSQNSPLHMAIVTNNSDLVKTLLTHNVDIESLNAEERRPLHLAAAIGSLEIFEVLLKRGALPNEYDCYQKTPIDIAIENGHIAIVEALCNTGITMSISYGPCGTGSLHTAVLKGHISVVRFLLDRGIEGEVCDPLLHAAALKGNLEITRLLLAKGAHLEASFFDELTPLYVAAKYGRREVVKELLSAGAQKEIKDKDGYSPLLIAVEREHYDVVKILLEHGADRNAKTNKGFTAFEIATKSRNQEILRLLNTLQ